MLAAKYRHMIVALLMMLFIGQVVASTSLSCQSLSAPLQGHEQMIDSSMMDHAQHMGSNTLSFVDTATVECCADCDCSLGGCTSSVALPVYQATFSASFKSKAGYYNESADSQLVVSLFRPPIIR
jgi:hypothetical protein